MSCCHNFIDQIKELKFQQSNSSTTPWKDAPEDKDDHAVVCAEWIVMELPRDPKNLLYGVYNKQGTRYEDVLSDPVKAAQQREQDWAMQALSDNRDTPDQNYSFTDLYTYNGGIYNE
jgi:hypothetical protein